MSKRLKILISFLIFIIVSIVSIYILYFSKIDISFLKFIDTNLELKYKKQIDKISGQIESAMNLKNSIIDDYLSKIDPAKYTNKSGSKNLDIKTELLDFEKIKKDSNDILVKIKFVDTNKNILFSTDENETVKTNSLLGFKSADNIENRSDLFNKSDKTGFIFDNVNNYIITKKLKYDQTNNLIGVVLFYFKNALFNDVLLKNDEFIFKSVNFIDNNLILLNKPDVVPLENLTGIDFKNEKIKTISVKSSLKKENESDITTDRKYRVFIKNLLKFDLVICLLADNDSFSLDKTRKIILTFLLYFTLYLLILIILLFKKSDYDKARDKVSIFTTVLVEEMINAKNKDDFEKIRNGLSVKKQAILKNIYIDFKKLKEDDKKSLEDQLNAVLNKIDESFEKKYTGEINTQSLEKIEKMFEKFISVISEKGIPVNFSDKNIRSIADKSVIKTSENPEEIEEISEAEETEDTEEIEEMEEISETGDAEEIPEAEDIEEIEEIEEIQETIESEDASEEEITPDAEIQETIEFEDALEEEIAPDAVIQETLESEEALEDEIAPDAEIQETLESEEVLEEEIKQEEEIPETLESEEAIEEQITLDAEIQETIESEEALEDEISPDVEIQETIEFEDASLNVPIIDFKISEILESEEISADELTSDDENPETIELEELSFEKPINDLKDTDIIKDNDLPEIIEISDETIDESQINTKKIINFDQTEKDLEVLEKIFQKDSEIELIKPSYEYLINNTSKDNNKDIQEPEELEEIPEFEEVIEDSSDNFEIMEEVNEINEQLEEEFQEKIEELEEVNEDLPYDLFLQSLGIDANNNKNTEKTEDTQIETVYEELKSVNGEKLSDESDNYESYIENKQNIPEKNELYDDYVIVGANNQINIDIVSILNNFPSLDNAENNISGFENMENNYENLSVNENDNISDEKINIPEDNNESNKLVYEEDIEEMDELEELDEINDTEMIKESDVNDNDNDNVLRIPDDFYNTETINDELTENIKNIDKKNSFLEDYFQNIFIDAKASNLHLFINLGEELSFYKTISIGIDYGYTGKVIFDKNNIFIKDLFENKNSIMIENIDEIKNILKFEKEMIDFSNVKSLMIYPFTFFNRIKSLLFICFPDNNFYKISKIKTNLNENFDEIRKEILRIV